MTTMAWNGNSNGSGSTNNGHLPPSQGAGPVFKNPLTLWGSPPPPAKRQKTGHGHGRSGSDDGTGGTSSRSGRALDASPQAVLSRSQPTPAAASVRPLSTSPKKPGTGASPAQRGSRLGRHPEAAPTGFKRAVENNQVVFVIDDDDDDEQPPKALAKPRVPVPAAGSAITSVGAAASPAASHPPPVNGLRPVQTPGSIAQAALLSASPQQHLQQFQRQELPTQTQTSAQQPLPNTAAAPSVAPSVAPSLFAKHDANIPPPLVLSGSSIKRPPADDSPAHNGRGQNLSKLSLNGQVRPPSSFMSPSLPSVYPPRSRAEEAYLSSPPSLRPSGLFSPLARHAVQQLEQPAREQPEATGTGTQRAATGSLATIGAPVKQQGLDFVRFSTPARRPYLRTTHRDFVSQNYNSLQNVLQLRCGQSATVIHVDFTPDEVQHLLDVARAVTPFPKTSQKPSAPEKELKSLIRGRHDVSKLVVSGIEQNCLPGRSPDDIYAFLSDVCSSRHRGRTAKPSSVPTALILQCHDRSIYYAQEEQAARATKLNALLVAREVAGHRTVVGRTPQPINVTNEFRRLREDSLRLRNEWTNCAGDVTTISWTSDDAFICGTTTHMDDRNHEYNRQGNLALASVGSGTLRAYPDHRIVRPLVRRRDLMASQDNTLSSRRATYDDPWLYTSVVSSDFDAAHDLAFTSGFDNTVKVWRVSKDGNSMTPMGTWRHEGKVNFVVASSDPVGLIATAADVSMDAVRVYRLPGPLSNGRITYKTLSCSRIVDLEGRPVLTDKWAYFPAAIRWGLTETTRHLLLVGYSPRSLSITTDDEDIPEDRRNSGELCLWDGLTGERWRIMGGTSQNVFEVAWHPTQPWFAAATSRNIHSIEENMRTQIRIFRPSNNKEYGGRAYSEVQTLDCLADDINELALFPNSFAYLYAAAGCTNGHTYVWDTSQGDNPIHDLAHGKCIEELSGEKISVEDTGVKFVAWGATPDRLYTGSSDGVVKVWNIRTHRTSSAQPFVRNLLHCPAPVSFGAFSANKSKLAIGDASGRVFLLSVEDGMEKNDEDEGFLSEADEDTHHLPSSVESGIRDRKTFKQHPPEIIRHSTPPPPLAPVQIPTVDGSAAGTDRPATTQLGNDDDDSGLACARAFLASGQLVIVPDRTIGAVKGPNYADTKLFCPGFHFGNLPENPLLAQFDRHQQENRPRASTAPSRQRPLRSVFNKAALSTYDGGLVGRGQNFGTNTAHTINDYYHSDNTNSGDGVFGVENLQMLQKQNLTQQIRNLHQRNMARDLDVDGLPEETRQALELADRAALLHLDEEYDYGFAYEEVPDGL